MTVYVVKKFTDYNDEYHVKFEIYEIFDSKEKATHYVETYKDYAYEKSINSTVNNEPTLVYVNNINRSGDYAIEIEPFELR